MVDRPTYSFESLVVGTDVILVELNSSRIEVWVARKSDSDVVQERTRVLPVGLAMGES